MKRILPLVLSAVFLLGVAEGEPGRADGRARILLLNMTLVDGVVRLNGIEIADGTLKQPKKVTLTKDRIHFGIQNAGGKQLFEGTLRDPSRIRYEYVDEDGRLQTKLVVKDSVEFTVRVPYDPLIRQATFTKIVEEPGSAATVQDVGQNLGSVTIRLEGESDEE